LQRLKISCWYFLGWIVVRVSDGILNERI
jgi:hypothetical protein